MTVRRHPRRRNELDRQLCKRKVASVMVTGHSPPRISRARFPALWTTARSLLIASAAMLAVQQSAQAQGVVLGAGAGYQVVGAGGSGPSPVASAVLQLGLGRTLFLGYGVNAILSSTIAGAREFGHGPLADLYLKNTPGWQPHLQGGFQWNSARDDTVEPWRSVVAAVGLRKGVIDLVFRGTFPRPADRSSYYAFEVHLGCLCGGRSRDYVLDVSPRSQRFDALRDTAQLTAIWTESVDPEDADEDPETKPVVPGDSLRWSSEDLAVAAVDKAGIVTAAGNGTPQVVARAGTDGASGRATVTVEQLPQELSLTPQRVNLTAMGETAPVGAVVRDRLGAEISGARVGWASSDPSIASVDADGLIRAEANGTAQVTARSGAMSATVDVTVAVEAASLEVVPTSDTIAALGGTLLIRATVRDRTGAELPGAAIRWVSSAPDVATVDPNGQVTAVANGRAEVTAVVEGVSATVFVTVAQRAVAIEVGPSDQITLELSKVVQLTATARDANGEAIDDFEVEWITSAPQTVGIDANGRATAYGFGVATVTAMGEGASASVTITVSPRSGERTR